LTNTKSLLGFPDSELIGISVPEYKSLKLNRQQSFAYIGGTHSTGNIVPKTQYEAPEIYDDPAEESPYDDSLALTMHKIVEVSTSNHPKLP